MNKQLLRPFLVLLLLAVMLGAEGQTVWNKTYIEDRPSMIFGSILDVDSGYIVSGSTYGTISNLEKSLIGNIDLTGSMTQYKIVVDSAPVSYVTYSNALIKTTNGKIAFSGSSSDSVPYILFGLGNMNLDSISVFKYYTPQTYGCHGSSLLQYGSDYFITGIQLLSPGFNADVVLLKIDSSGKRVWEKYYNQSTRDFAVSIIKLNNGNLMLGAGRNDLNQTHQHSNTWLIEVDTAGQVVRQWIDPNDSSYLPQGLLQTKDGGFIYGAQKYHSQPFGDVYYTGAVVKMDANFNKQWTFNDGRYNDLTGIYDLVELPDGSFVGCGNKPFYYGDSSTVSGWVVKLSSTGQVIWNKIYRGIDSTYTRNYLNDLEVIPDGSLIAVGYSKYSGHTPPYVGWMLKLDSNGCEMESCLTTDVSSIPNPPSDFRIFPNPLPNSTSSLTIDIDETLLGSTAVIYDIMGRAITNDKLRMTNNSLHVAGLSRGVYLVSVTSLDGRKAVKKLVVE